MKVVRASLLIAAVVLAAASTDGQQPPPQYPQQYGAYGDGSGQPGQPGQPGGQVAPGAGQDYCFTLKTQQTTTSLCGTGFAACEQQRQGAVGDGLSTTECVPWAPVACFQLGGNPSPQSTWCAANIEDCESWRRADREKNGSTGDACKLKQ